MEETKSSNEGKMSVPEQISDSNIDPIAAPMPVTSPNNIFLQVRTIPKRSSEQNEVSPHNRQQLFRMSQYSPQRKRC
ncbi:hypothetical protein KIN20_032527 [Parelaphostrongylus tenuis]|uniref:Uncharacterized protein n=1 Tax=Parelaphostrongylus tenuis TaxID=148309 RepID=A0AAD5R7A8_PARTN|nr:hypothetical protein KIN20_032527 [Parelaphostrongylus tenuis]